MVSTQKNDDQRSTITRREIPNTSPVRYNLGLHRGPGPEPLRPLVEERLQNTAQLWVTMGGQWILVPRKVASQ